MAGICVLRDTPVDDLINSYHKLGSVTKVLEAYGVPVSNSRAYRFVKNTLVEASVWEPKLSRMGYTIDDVRCAVSVSMCMSDVLRILKLSTSGGNSTTINRLCDEHDIDISHFDVKESMQRNKVRYCHEDIFRENSEVPRAGLRTHIIRRGVLGDQVCAECGIVTIYNNKPISLTVDHINGVSNDNRIENLRWLCPNCHSQTDTYCGKNVKRK